MQAEREYEATLETPLACYPPEPLEAALDALRAHGVEPGASRALTLAAVDAALADRAAERETIGAAEKARVAGASESIVRASELRCGRRR